MMTQAEKAWLISMTQSAEDYARWLLIMKFGIKRLLEDQRFLTNLIIDRAEKMLNENPDYSAGENHIATKAIEIITDLGLTLAIAPTTEGSKT
jgi:hypothetical protein